MFLPVILYENNKQYYFRDISLMISYLKGKYKNFRLTKPNEKTLIIRKNKEIIVVYYEYLRKELN